VNQVGVRVLTAEVGLGVAVQYRARLRPEHTLENLLRVGAGDGVHGVEAHGEQPGVEELADALEVEQLLHQHRVVGDRVDDLHGHPADRRRAALIEVDRCGLDGQVAVDLSGAVVDRLGHGLGGGAAVRDVELDPEVAVGPAGVVTGRQDQAPWARRLRITQDAAGVDSQPCWPTTVRATPLAAASRRITAPLPVVVAAVAAEHQGPATQGRLGVEDRLDEVLEVAGGLEYRHLLAQAGGAGRCPSKGDVRTVVIDMASPPYGQAVGRRRVFHHGAQGT